MIAEYARFVKEVFPSITPETAKKLIGAAGWSGFTDEQYFATTLGDKLCQGDVVEGFRWIYEEEDGSYRRTPFGSGMLLSHSCDVDNDEWLTFAPCFPFNAALPKAQEIKRNELFDVYFLPAHQSRGATLADFARPQAVRATRVLRGLEEDTLRRVDSFTPLGYYHFILKLTMHLLRPQPDDEVRYSCRAPVSERLAYVATASVGLVRYTVLGTSV